MGGLTWNRIARDGRSARCRYVQLEHFRQRRTRVTRPMQFATLTRSDLIRLYTEYERCELDAEVIREKETDDFHILLTQ
jgi:hypothetical protein